MNKRYAVVAPIQLGEIGKPQMLLKTGMYHFRDIGDHEFKPSDLAEMVANFKAGVYGQDIAVNAEHMHEFGALGDVLDIWTQNNDTELWGVFNYNDYGAPQVKEGRWHYNSVEVYHEWQHPVTQVVYHNVLFGVAHTNYPRIKNMQRIAASENPDLPEVVPFDDPDISGMTGLPTEDWATLSEEEKAAIALADDGDEDDKRTPQSTRDKLPTSAFAFVKQRKILITNAGHVKAGVGRFKQVQGVTDAERDTAWARLKRAASRFGVKVPASWRDLGKSEHSELTQGVLNVDEKEQLAKLAERQTQFETQMSEMKKSLEASETARKAAEAKVTTLSEQLSETTRLLGVERSARELMEFSEGLDVALRQGRLTPAEKSDYLAKAGEYSAELRAFILEDVKKRAVKITMNEIGSGNNATGETGANGTRTETAFNEAGQKVTILKDRVNLAELAHKLMTEQKVSYGAALKLAQAQIRNGGQA